MTDKPWLTTDEVDELRSRHVPGVINNAPFFELNLHPDYRFPVVLPHGWQVLEQRLTGYAYGMPFGMCAIASINMELDKKRWLHIAVTKPSGKPDWEDVRKIYDLFCQGRQMVVQVPEVVRYEMQHPNTVHLWCCLDVNILPDFSHGRGYL